MILHKDLENFKALISLTAKDMGILEFYIEKDYWVTYILKKLSSSSFKNEVVFKGGTSLSKGYNAINRFSEDIDLQLTNSSLGDNQKKKLLKNIEETITEGMIYLWFIFQNTLENLKKVVIQNDFFRKRKDTLYRNSFLYNTFERINKIESIYNTKFKSMVFGEFPDFESLKDTLKTLLDFIDKWEKEYRKENQ